MYDEPSPTNAGADLAARAPRGRGLMRALALALMLALAGYGAWNGAVSLADEDPVATATSPATSDASADLLAAQAETPYASVADLFAAVDPSVVTVYNQQAVESRSPFGVQPESDGELQDVAAGSGWILDEEGHVVTNAHVVAGAEDVQVRLYDGTVVDATLIGVDEVQDVAVLQLDLDEGETVPGVATVGDSDDIRAGEEVVSIGTALGEFTNSVSSGIVGGLDRSLATDTASIANLIQHDADISSGNSGGPLLNMNGEVIGMNVAKIDSSAQQQYSASGLYFAIEINAVMNSVNQILEDGQVVYPYLGVETQQGDTSALVVNVVEGGPADEAGILPGDEITAVAGVSMADGAGLTELLYQHLPGDEIELTILRDGEEQTVTVTLGSRPSSLD